jgi:hypothetical protein
VKTIKIIACIFVVMSSVWVFAEDAPRVYTDSDLQNYRSSSGDSSKSRDSSDIYYQDRREERKQYYDDKKETREEDKRDKDISDAQRRLDMEQRNKRREECRSEAESKRFWCPAKDDGCRRQWTNAYRDCNFID